MRRLTLLLTVLVPLCCCVPAARIAQAADSSAPTLPGVSVNLQSHARALQSNPSRPEAPACTWCSRERASRWLPALGLAAASTTVALVADPPRDPRWDTRNRFDDAIQDGLSGGSSSTRDGAATASDVLVGALGVALAGDIWLLRDEYPLEQSISTGLAATMGTLLVTETAKASAGRERPYVRRCRSDPGYTDSCNSGRDDNASFFSTHASESATLASLVCVRRLYRRESTWNDRLVCGLASATSVTTGVLRITADEHYFTDVLAGWATGVLFGAVLPIVLPQWSGVGQPEATHTIAPVAGDRSIGLQYVRSF